MTAATSPQASAPAQSQLSVTQMLSVMRVEFHRAQSQQYPMTCLMVAVDGLDMLREMYGHQEKQRLMRVAYDCLRSMSRKHSFIGMALMSGDRIMAVFPNTPASRLSTLGENMVATARSLKIEVAGKPYLFSLSLGASHSQLDETQTFEGLVEASGRSLAMATEAGGNRYVMWREAEGELDELRTQIEESVKAFAEQQATMVEEASDFSGLQQAAVIDEIQAVFGSCERTPELARVEKEVLRLAAKELFDERQKAIQAVALEHKNQIDLLERRLVKLTGVLGVTESELKRVMAMKSIDPGVASIYSCVQGLDGDEESAETKAAMMVSIFEANVSLQGKST
jgi:diguanylate cyclase (GGDEF)-like protein